MYRYGMSEKYFTNLVTEYKDRKIDGIKQLRADLACGLKEAKDLYEHYHALVLKGYIPGQNIYETKNSATLGDILGHLKKMEMVVQSWEPVNGIWKDRYTFQTIEEGRRVLTMLKELLGHTNIRLLERKYTENEIF